ncbi:efflux RND transporter periplasmic adaptor subunit [Undibacterium baiyunense]|uniref:Efflux RND transporter periplasmic adaptor subunit n=1 Tax=Undibacterium baiyunense TaxID=2828731 RepID=A0A941I2B5_9BURK|nr:efflux RND transporter periplasmic adaptor subunit [Undibacterium baiyunense]MBR7745161.1 efflux RND transporter periplasmic adaptor subunit [Undibacterium baiyunense]
MKFLSQLTQSSPLKYRNQAIAVGIVLVVGVVLATAILFSNKPTSKTEDHDKASHAGEHAEKVGEERANDQKGPHGGRLFTQGTYALEVTIFEVDSVPVFRLYPYQNGKPLAPSANNVTILVQRLGQEAQTYRFKPEQDYLTSADELEEPHSFDVKIKAVFNQETYDFHYEQIEGRVQMSEQQRKNNGIETQVAGPMLLQSTMSLLGEIRLNADNTVHVVPRLTGLVEHVLVNAGDKVKQGQVLAVISSQLLADQRSEVLAAQKRFALAKKNFEREKKLWEEKISAEQDYLAAQNALQEAEITRQSAEQKLAALGANSPISTTGGSLTRLEIRSPINGTITEKNIAMGQVLKEDATIFTVTNLDTVWVEAVIPAKELGQIKVGQKATISATAFEASTTGKVSYVGSVVGDQTLSAMARLVVSNAKGMWYPGLPVNLVVQSAAVNTPVVVASEAIQNVNETSSVFIKVGDQFEVRPVELGRTNGKFTELLKGLQAGETYVSKNSFLMKAELGKSSASHDD